MVTFIELRTALVDNKNYEIASFASVHSDQAQKRMGGIETDQDVTEKDKNTNFYFLFHQINHIKKQQHANLFIL